MDLKYTSATRTDKLKSVDGPNRLRYRSNRQAAAERQFLALRNTKPETKEEQHGQEKLSN